MDQAGFGAQQGAIYVFVALIFVYIHQMQKLDRQYGVSDDEDESSNKRTCDMDAQSLTYLFVALSFGLYIGMPFGLAPVNQRVLCGRRRRTPIANGMATAADWMSAASFISMAGIIAFMGYDGAVYLMGWTGGYVILRYYSPHTAQIRSVTVPDFIGTRYIPPPPGSSW